MDHATATAEVDAFAKALVEEMTVFIQKKYRAPKFKVAARNDFSIRRTTSWGGFNNGKNYISLALHHYVSAAKDGKPMSFIEYDHIAKKEKIGSLIDVSWKHSLAALIAHEMAHAVQHGSISRNALSAHKSASFDLSAHGVLWQQIYATLRDKFVNNNAFSEIKTEVKQIAKKATRSTNRDWYMKEVNKNGGRYAFYHRKSDGGVIGVLFNKWRDKVYIYKPETNEYVDTGLYDFRAARKIHFGF